MVFLSLVCWEDHLLRRPLVENTTCWEYHLLRIPLVENTTCWEYHLLKRPLAEKTKGAFGSTIMLIVLGVNIMWPSLINGAFLKTYNWTLKLNTVSEFLTYEGSLSQYGKTLPYKLDVAFKNRVWPGVRIFFWRNKVVGLAQPVSINFCFMCVKLEIKYKWTELQSYLWFNSSTFVLSINWNVCEYEIKACYKPVSHDKRSAASSGEHYSRKAFVKTLFCSSSTC